MTARTLVILRHAQAAYPTHTSDLDRPLTERGQADAAAAGAWLARHGYVPDEVLCSPARRTTQTWQALAPALGVDPPVRFEDRLYGALAPELVARLRQLPDAVGTLLLIGHNPSVSQLSLVLDPQRADRAGLRTATLAVHTLDGPWDQCGPQAAPLTATHTARA